MSIKLLKHQIEPCNRLVDIICNSLASHPKVIQDGKNLIKRREGAILIGNMGCGKSFILAEALRKCQEKGFLLPNPDKPLRPSSLIFTVPKAAIEKHKRVLHRANVKDFEVTSGSALASNGGALMINWETIYDAQGEIKDILPKWDDEMAPDVIIADECQLYKNPSANKTKVFQNYVEQGGLLILSSGTPCSKASETKLIATACGITTPSNWTYYANGLSTMGINANSPTAMKNFKIDLQGAGRLVEVSNVRYPFKPVVKNYMLTLSSLKLPIYNGAYAEYLAEVAKAGKNGPQGIRAVWVAMKKFQQKAEELRADELAERAYYVQTRDNKAIILAANHLKTLGIAYASLIKKGVHPSKISVLRGGMSADNAQSNIDRFQDGTTLYFLVTLKCGGTSIDLNHGEDNKHVLPRHVILPPTWSVFDMSQVLWRANRINNVSEVVEEILWYKETIEEDVADRLADKFSCLKELLQRKESFIYDIFVKTAGKVVAEELESLVKEEEVSTTSKNKDDSEEEDTELDLSMLD